MVGRTAYLIQITQNVDHGIKAGLLDVLKYLPEHLDVEFIWAVPPKVLVEETFNSKDLPVQQDDQPATSGPEHDSHDLIAQRLQACKQQFKIPVSVDGLANYSTSTSEADSSVSQGAASPDTGSSSSVAAFSDMARVTGRLLEAQSMYPKVGALPPITSSLYMSAVLLPRSCKCFQTSLC